MALKHYFIVGGLPEAVTTYVRNITEPFVAFNEVRLKQLELLNTYRADMAKHCGKQNAMHIERLWSNIPAQLAKSLAGNAAKFIFKDVIPGIKGHARLAGVIDWLKSAGLIIQTMIANRAELPLRAFTKDSVFKLYVFDVGLLGALSELPPQTILNYSYGSYKGYFAENFAAQEFVAHQLPISGALVGWKEHESEVEFLREIDGDIIPVEVKAGPHAGRKRSLAVYTSKYSPSARIVMSSNNTTKRGATVNLPLYCAGWLETAVRSSMRAWR